MGMRRAENPVNPYTAEHCEWLGPPPEVELEVYEEHARGILSQNDSPDIAFRWSVNPYRGCQHACAYCYARPTHEYLGFGAGTDFDTRVCVKVNAVELLRAALSKPSWKRELIAFSGVTDCYQPLEAVYRLTRGCLEACADWRTPVGVVTKSYLIVRDIDVLSALSKASAARVYFSIPFADDAMARKIELGAPSPTKRFEAMRKLADAGIEVSVLVAPIIPGLNDREIPAVLKRAAESGARSAGFTTLRLPGPVREVFLSRLRQALPLHADRVEARIRDVRGGELTESRFGRRMAGVGEYWNGVERLFRMAAARHGVDGRHEAPPAPPPAPRVVQLGLFDERG